LDLNAHSTQREIVKTQWPRTKRHKSWCQNKGPRLPYTYP